MSEWISVEDKLPKFEQEVLLFSGDEILTGEYLPSELNEFNIHFDEGFWINGGATIIQATHWMPLPEPPK